MASSTWRRHGVVVSGRRHGRPVVVVSVAPSSLSSCRRCRRVVAVVVSSSSLTWRSHRGVVEVGVVDVGRRGGRAGDMAVVLYPVVGSWFVVRGFTFCWPGRPMSRVRDEAVVR